MFLFSTNKERDNLIEEFLHNFYMGIIMEENLN